MLIRSPHALRLIPSWITFFAVAITVSATPSLSDPTPMEPGWTVRKFMEGLEGPQFGMAGDEVSGDLFVADFLPDYSALAIYRVTPEGSRTTIFTTNQNGISELAFDPTSRLLYAGDRSNLSVISESGVQLEFEHHPYPPGGMALGPDGTLYFLDPDYDRIVRYDRASHTFPIVTTFPELGYHQELQVDEGGNFYVKFGGSGGVARITAAGEVSYGSGPNPLCLSGFDLLGQDLMFGNCSIVYRLSGGLGSPTSFCEGIDPPLYHVCVVQDRVYVKDAVAPWENNVWEFSPAGPTPVKKDTWGQLKTLYR